MSSAANHKSIPGANISRVAAASLISAALQSAEKLGFGAAVAVVDSTGSLRAFERSDDALFLAADIAVDKAWTAASFGFPTHVWNDVIQNPAAAPLSQRARITAVPGGHALTENGLLIGGIGVSGGTAEQDQKACEMAMTAEGFDLFQGT